MAWKQVVFHTHTALAERLSDALHELGAAAVTLQDDADQPVLEPLPGETPLWQQTRVEGLFEQDADFPALLQALKQVISPETLPAYDIQDVPDQDWERAWLDNFKPMQFGHRLWIVPSAYEAEDPQAVNIRLDPGLAFGTGTHPTTALCLRWLDGADLNGKRVIDFGCGSGILAIAAAKLGASEVVGTDIDPQALQASADNARENGVENAIVLVPAEGFSSKPVDILLANILANPLKALAEQFSAYVKPGGEIVLSGILQEQAQEVLLIYQTWFKMQEPVVQDEWVMLYGVRRDTTE